MLQRRDFLALLGALGAYGVCGGSVAEGAPMGKEEAFSKDLLVKKARTLARDPYAPPRIAARALLEKIDFDQHNDIAFKPERTLGLGKPFPVQFFHPGKFFKEPVSLFWVEGGKAAPITYSKDFFSFGKKVDFAKKLPSNVGFSGFRVMNTDLEGDWIAYLGASYFRSAGPLNQYGLSARALAIDTALQKPEEFPRFVSFYLEPLTDALRVHALLDGPSVSGAFTFEWRKGKAVTTDVEGHIFMRKDIERLGIAPLTGMFWYSETRGSGGVDWRPEVHDCDGLSLWTGSGERLFRPLNNPPRVMTSSFLDDAPRGFGLMQRDRSFENYQDDGVFYNRRPSVWVEPLGAWGKGRVQLVEIPTDLEIHDNIVAYWVSDEPARKGDERVFSYRLHWAEEEPSFPALARTVATRLGKGGNPATGRVGFVKYVVDFEGGGIERFTSQDGLRAIVSASMGKVDDAYALRVNTTDRWRLGFDLGEVGPDPVELRAYIALADGTPVTETWCRQHLSV